MKRLAAILLVPFLLFGCGKDGPNPDISIPGNVVDMEERFLDAVHEEIPGSDEVPDFVMLKIAQDICDLMEEGITEYEMFEYATVSGLDAGDAGYLVGASRGAFCPDEEFEDE